MVRRGATPRTLRVREGGFWVILKILLWLTWELEELFIDRQNSRGDVDLGMIFG